MYFGIRDAVQARHTSCEVPLDAWAITAGSTLLLVALLQLLQFSVSACSLACRGPAADGRPAEADPSAKGRVRSRCAQCSAARCCEGFRVGSAFFSAASSRGPRTGMLIMTGLIAFVVTFVVAWFMVGAVWVFPLRDKPSADHGCDPSLVSVSFYVILVVLVALAVVAVVGCIVACCAVLLAASVCAACRGIVDSMLIQMGFLTPRAPPSNGGAAASGAGSGLQSAAGAVAGAAVGATAPKGVDSATGRSSAADTQGGVQSAADEESPLLLRSPHLPADVDPSAVYQPPSRGQAKQRRA